MAINLANALFSNSIEKNQKWFALTCDEGQHKFSLVQFMLTLVLSLYYSQLSREIEEKEKGREGEGKGDRLIIEKWFM